MLVHKVLGSVQWWPVSPPSTSHSLMSEIHNHEPNRPIVKLIIKMVLSKKTFLATFLTSR